MEKSTIIRRVLYSSKASSRDFLNNLRSFMSHLDFKSYLAKPDMRMRLAINLDRNEYYEYILLYIDDALLISENTEFILRNKLINIFIGSQRYILVTQLGRLH